MSEVRSAAAMVGYPDQPKLVQDVLVNLIGAQTVSDCIGIWNDYVKPVSDVLEADTVAQLERAVAIRVTSIAPRE